MNPRQLGQSAHCLTLPCCRRGRLLGRSSQPKKRKKDRTRDEGEADTAEEEKPNAKRDEQGEIREASEGKKSSKKKKERKKLAASAENGKEIDEAGAGAPRPTPNREGNASSSATNVSVEGMAVTPLKDFASAKMPAEVMKYVTKRGWTQPTPIQSYCWPVLNAGRDVVGIAETGSGKTIAFSLPALSRIFKAKSKVGRRAEEDSGLARGSGS